MSLKYLVLFLLFALSFDFYAQSPYEINWRKELPFVSTAAGTMGVATLFYMQPVRIRAEDLIVSNAQAVNPFDRVATRFYSNLADDASDILWMGSSVAPFLFLANKNTRSHFGQIMTMYGEAAIINFGLTVATKYATKRNRPYVYNSNAPDDLRLSAGAQTSFFSGHTSMTATNTFFAAKIFSDFYPESKWKPVAWGTAIAIPAVTGYLRVRAGKHYLSDVMVGYAVGALTGFFVPHFHRKSKLKEKGLTFQVGIKSIYFAWGFNKNEKETQLGFFD